MWLIIAHPAGAEQIIFHTQQRDVAFDAMIADTDAERMKGLMFVWDMPDNTAMLFIYPEHKPVSMWMKNTYIPLDIIFVDAENKISNIHADAQPHDLTPIHSEGKVAYVVELPSGSAKKHGISIGNRLTSIFEE
jgi:uncharacterized protein